MGHGTSPSYIPYTPYKHARTDLVPKRCRANSAGIVSVSNRFWHVMACLLEGTSPPKNGVVYTNANPTVDSSRFKHCSMPCYYVSY